MNEKNVLILQLGFVLNIFSIKRWIQLFFMLIFFSRTLGFHTTFPQFSIKQKQRLSILPKIHLNLVDSKSLISNFDESISFFQLNVGRKITQPKQKLSDIEFNKQGRLSHEEELMLIQQCQMNHCLLTYRSHKMYKNRRFIDWDEIAVDFNLTLIQLEQIQLDADQSFSILRRVYTPLIYFAKRKCSYSNSGLDLMSVGEEGLSDAIVNFDPKVSLSFRSYCTWWIQRYIMEKIKSAKIIRTSQSTDAVCKSLKRMDEEVVEMTGLAPSPEDISRELMIPLAKVQKVIKDKRFVSKAEDALTWQEKNKDKFINAYSNYTQEYFRKIWQWRTRQHRNLKVVSFQEKTVIKLRLGIQDKYFAHVFKHDEIASIMNISVVNVRQLEYSALQKLCHHHKMDKTTLKIFLQSGRRLKNKKQKLKVDILKDDVLLEQEFKKVVDFDKIVDDSLSIMVENDKMDKYNAEDDEEEKEGKKKEKKKQFSIEDLNEMGLEESVKDKMIKEYLDEKRSEAKLKKKLANKDKYTVKLSLDDHNKKISSLAKSSLQSFDKTGLW